MSRSDSQVRELLREIDVSDEIDVSSWEASFIDSVLYKYSGPLSQKQLESANQIINRYQRQL